MAASCHIGRRTFHLIGRYNPLNEVIAAIRERNIPTIMGNYDLGVGHDGDDCGCAYRTPEAKPEASLERLLDMVEANVLVCGHTHLPYHRVLSSGRHVINAGSVGKPKDNDPRAC